MIDHQVARRLVGRFRCLLDEHERPDEKLKLRFARDVRQHDQTRMQLDVTDELSEIIRVVRDADTVFADAEAEDFRIRCAKQVPIAGASGVLAALVSDGDEPGCEVLVDEQPHARLVRRVVPSRQGFAGRPRRGCVLAYRAATFRKAPRIEAWPEVLTLGHSLPVMPLWLSLDLSIPVHLEESYLATCRSLRIPA